MLERILPYEENLFFLINRSHSYFMDCAMWLFSGGVIWIPPAVFLIISIVYKKEWRIWLPILITIIILFVCCDQFSSAVCKPYFARPRPTHYPGIEESVRTLCGYTGGKYGFISGHATNSFGFATLSALLFRNKYYSIVIYVWAIILSYSRIYLGVHFVSDIVAGAVAGSVIGLLVYNLLHAYMVKNKHGQNYAHPYSKQRTRVTTLVLACYIVSVVAFGEPLIYIFQTNLFP
ncbi:MAG: phosphatase PAP2 family protein [Dysgonomonas sp.]